jgi:excisionase family DNA binding protein
VTRAERIAELVKLLSEDGDEVRPTAGGEVVRMVPAIAPQLPDELWDAVDVAKFLKVSRSWVYKRAELGELPHRRCGGLLRFDPDRIRAYARGDAGRVLALSRVD